MNNPRSLPREHKGRVGDKCVNDWSIRRPKRERLAVCRRKEVNILSCRNRRCRFHGYSKKNSRSLRCVRMNQRTIVLFLSLPRSEGWPNHGRTFSIYLYPLSFWLTLPQRVLSTTWCCPTSGSRRIAMGVEQCLQHLATSQKWYTWTAISLLLRKVFNKYGAVVFRLSFSVDNAATFFPKLAGIPPYMSRE